MTPADEVKNESTIEKSSGIELSYKATVVTLVVLLVLIVTAGVMVCDLVNSEQVKLMTVSTILPTKTKVVSSKDLEAYTLITEDDLMVIPGTNETPDPKVKNDLLDRYMLTKVLLGTEIKPEMLTPTEAKGLMSNCVAVSIPATATSTLGSQLRVGDMIDLFAVPANQPPLNQSAQSKLPTFENLLVLNVPIKKDPKPDEKNLAEVGAITVALPATRRYEFATSITGATIVITRRVSVK